MLWFKHMADARHDPFIWDVKKCFGSRGYRIYFETLEIYADSFRPSEGWCLDVSVDYLKHELKIYHTKTLRQIFDFFRSWPAVDLRTGKPIPEGAGKKIAARSGGDTRGDTREDRAQSSRESLQNLNRICPKCIAYFYEDRVRLIIPNFSKIMDEYSKKKIRQTGEVSGQCPESGRPKQTRRDREEKNNVAAIFRDLSRDCETLSTLPVAEGKWFPGSDFVDDCINKDFHPAAIRDGTQALIDIWDGAQNPWGYALGVVKSCAQKYKDDPINPLLVKSIFGGFFNAKTT